MNEVLNKILLIIYSRRKIMSNESHKRIDYSPENVRRNKSLNYLLTYPLDLLGNNGVEKYYMSFRSYEPESITVEKVPKGVTPNKNIESTLNINQVTGVYKTTFSVTDPVQVKSNICLAIPGDSMVTSYNQEYSESEIDNIVSKVLTSAAGMMNDQGMSFGNAMYQAIVGEGANSLLKMAQTMSGGVDVGLLFNVASNPHVQVIYNKPTLRTHSFNFLFYPTSKEETNRVNEIIQTFKRDSSPEIYNDNRSVLKRPCMFDIRCESSSSISSSSNIVTDKYMFRIVNAVLTNVTVDYLAQKLPSFFKDMAPTAISLSLSFKDTRIITRDDIDEYNL